MGAGTDFVIKNESALLFAPPSLRPAEFDGVALFGAACRAYFQNRDGLIVPVSDGALAVKRFGGRKSDTNSFEGLIAGIDELIGAVNSEMWLRRRDKTQFEVLFLNRVARTESQRTTANHEQSKRKKDSERKKFGARVLQGKAIVARGSCGSKEQFNESRSARFASANAGETGVRVSERFLAASGLGLALRVGHTVLNAIDDIFFTEAGIF